MQLIKQLWFYLITLYLSILPMPQYVEGVSGQPGSFMPHKITSQQDETISKLLYRGLFTYDIYGNLIPDLAESWSISEDGLVYTVTLKDDQYWSNGEPITSDDVIYTSFKLSDLQNVGTDKVDERTVRFILPNKFSPFLSLLTDGIIKDQSEEDYENFYAPTNGKFRVLNVRKSGPIIKDVVLLSLDKSHQIRKIIFRYYSNQEELVTAAKLGEIDGFLSTKEVRDLEKFKDSKFPLQGVYFAIFFNLSNESTQDVDIRTQLEQAINKEQIIYDKGILVEGPISRSVFTNRELDFNVYDPDLKADLETEFTLTIPDLETHKDLAQRIKDIWKEKLDVDLDIEPHDPETFVEEIIIPRNYELLLYGQEVSRDPGRYVNWHSTQKEHPGLNLSMYDQVFIDRALEEGRAELDPQERIDDYNAFQERLNEDVPAIFLYHPYKNYYISKFIEGVGEKYTFTLADRFLDFSNWSRLKTN